MTKSPSSGVGEAAVTGDLVTAALAYGQAGLRVLPIHTVREGVCSCGAVDCDRPAKHPLIKAGKDFSRASSDVAAIADWWRRWPDANIGIRTGAESGLVVLDVDVPKGGASSLAALEQEHGKLPSTPEVLTGGGGKHLLFRHPGQEVRPSAGQLGDGLDVRGDGGFIVAPPSLHVSGRPYKWVRTPEKVPAAPLPPWLETMVVEGVTKRRNGGRAGDAIPEGKRNAALTSLAGTMRRRGMGESEITAALLEVNAGRCRPPLGGSEVRALVDSVMRYQPENATADVPARTVAEVVEVFDRWLYLPDRSLVYVVLGAVAANLLEGSPVWLLLVGPPGGGKTEALQAVLALPDVYKAATFTEASLLSGTPSKHRASGAKGGLLREIGEFGLVIAKDFGSVLSMHREARGSILAALREIYDGEWTRYVGTDGGRTLTWQGKVGLLAGCTPSIDRHHVVMAAMGERFLLYRLGDIDPEEQAGAALTAVGAREARMRSELSQAVLGLFADGLPRQPREPDQEETGRLVMLSTLVARCRSSVERDGYSREIELIPPAELPARLAKVLERLLAGLDAIGLDRGSAWQVVARTGLDSMPRMRRALLDILAHSGPPRETKDLALEVGYPTGTARRALEDLAAHGVLTRYSQGEGKSDLWGIAENVRVAYQSLSELAA